jgi:hypothetical protein
LKRTKIILLSVIIPFLLIQFITVEKKNPPVDNTIALTAPPKVMSILKNSCYDCHSNETEWPLYSYIAPVSWLVYRDVKFGRDDLNFSEWNNLSEKEKDKTKDEIIEEISRNTMPVPIYLITHPSASLSADDKLLIKNWLTGRKTEKITR